MPDQPTNQPTDQTQVTQPVTPPAFPQEDISQIPPMPPMEQTSPVLPETPPTNTNNNQVPTQPDIPPIITSSSSPKKGRGKVVAAILGVLLLVGAVGAGVVLVEQRQFFQQKASVTTCSNEYREGYENRCLGQAIGTVVVSCLFDSSCQQVNSGDHSYRCKASSVNGSDGNPLCVSDCFQDSACANPTAPPPSNSCGPDYNIPCGNGCIKWTCPNGDTNHDGECGPGDTGMTSDTFAGVGCPNVSCGNSCCQIDYTQDGTICHPPNCKELKLSCPPPTSPPGPTPTPSPTPRVTPSPKPNAQCSSVKAYNLSWQPLSTSDLAFLKPGDKVKFTVSGDPADQIDKAKFSIYANNADVLKLIVESGEVTQKKPGTNEYYYQFTIPAGITGFRVTAQIHHLTLGWF